jgi:Lrp/AsnC family transcriptional regulator for asnA, asnC and gidA
MAKVDNLDLKILSELSDDAAISIPKLSKKIDVNTSVVYSRIKRLLKRKIIEKYTIEINDKELGYTVKSFTGINIDSKQRDNVINGLFEINGVREISEVTGRFDILITMHAKNLAEMHRLISEGIGKIQGIIGSESFVEMKRRKKQTPYMVD